MDATDKDVAIGGAGLAAQAVELGLVDELRMFRYPVVIGGGTPFLPRVTDEVPLDLIETRTFGSLRDLRTLRAPAMSQPETASEPPDAAPTDCMPGGRGVNNVMGDQELVLVRGSPGPRCGRRDSNPHRPCGGPAF